MFGTKAKWLYSIKNVLAVLMSDKNNLAKVKPGYKVFCCSAKYELRANGEDMTQENPNSTALCFHRSNLAGIIYSTTSSEFFEGLRYWPIVTLSQPTLCKSFRTCSTSAPVSPNPSIIEDLVWIL